MPGKIYSWKESGYFGEPIEPSSSFSGYCERNLWRDSDDNPTPVTMGLTQQVSVAGIDISAKLCAVSVPHGYQVVFEPTTTLYIGMYRNIEKWSTLVDVHPIDSFKVKFNPGETEKNLTYNRLSGTFRVQDYLTDGINSV